MNNKFTNNDSNIGNQQFNNMNFQNNGLNTNQIRGNIQVNQNNDQVSNNYNKQSQGQNFDNCNQPNNNPQSIAGTVNYYDQIHSNKNPKDNKKILYIIIGVVIVIAIILALSILYGNKSNDNNQTNNGKSVYTISIDDFDVNSDTFKKYINKRITVTDVKVIDLDGLSFGPLPYKVDCSNMSSLDISEGDIVSVTGILNDKTYHGLWYYMDNCSISK